MKIEKLLICTGFLMGAIVAVAQSTIINGINYTYDYNTLSQTAVLTDMAMSSSPWTIRQEVIEIPRTIGGYKVVKLGTCFQNCAGMKKVVIPASVQTITSNIFTQSGSMAHTDLETVEFLGDAPDVSIEGNGILFNGLSKRLQVRVPHGSVGWAGGVSATLPNTWHDRAIMYSDEDYVWETETVRAETTVNIISTNVVIHVVQNSIEPTFAFPASNDMGFVNIITEVKNNGIASIPISWAMSYPNYTATFGTDFTASLMKPTGKKDATGKDMLVWQDYVAGTDPTNPNDVLRASITMVDGKPVISYSPELDAERKAMRAYTFYGKVRLTDEEWVEIEPNEVADYNFFKVTVEMK